MDDLRQDPLPLLRAAVKVAGGPSKVAEAAQVPRTHLHNVLAGTRRLGTETASKLRPILPDVPAEVWVELLAPVAEPEPVEVTA